MEAQENDPKSLRFLPPLICLASHITAVPVSAKNMASSEANLHNVAARYSGRIGLMSGPCQHNAVSVRQKTPSRQHICAGSGHQSFPGHLEVVLGGSL